MNVFLGLVIYMIVGGAMLSVSTNSIYSSTCKKTDFSETAETIATWPGVITYAIFVESDKIDIKNACEENSNG